MWPLRGARCAIYCLFARSRVPGALVAPRQRRLEPLAEQRDQLLDLVRRGRCGEIVGQHADQTIAPHVERYLARLDAGASTI
jgi:hypothetical protein